MRCFNGPSMVKHVVTRPATNAGDRRDPHLPGRNGASLVENQCLDRARLFKNVRSADQNACSSSSTGPYEQRHWSRKSEGARARNDQHRNAGRKRIFS